MRQSLSIVDATRGLKYGQIEKVAMDIVAMDIVAMDIVAMDIMISDSTGSLQSSTSW